MYTFPIVIAAISCGIRYSLATSCALIATRCVLHFARQLDWQAGRDSWFFCISKKLFTTHGMSLLQGLPNPVFGASGCRTTGAAYQQATLFVEPLSHLHVICPIGKPQALGYLTVDARQLPPGCPGDNNGSLRVPLDDANLHYILGNLQRGLHPAFLHVLRTSFMVDCWKTRFGCTAACKHPLSVSGQHIDRGKGNLRVNDTCTITSSLLSACFPALRCRQPAGRRGAARSDGGRSAAASRQRGAAGSRHRQPPRDGGHHGVPLVRALPAGRQHPGG